MGPDDLPQHLHDLTHWSAGAGGSSLLHALVEFSNLVLSGYTLARMCPLFFGATLLPLSKKDGGIRPIAIGCTLRLLVSNVAAAAVMKRLGALLAPLQIGYGTPLGESYSYLVSIILSCYCVIL